MATSPYYDLQRHGLGMVASPRHANLLLIPGPVTTRMRRALVTAYQTMPEPRRVAALGNCALGCRVLGHTDEIVGRVEDLFPVDLPISGCPPTPTQIAEALITFLDEDPNVRIPPAQTSDHPRTVSRKARNGLALPSADERT